MQSWDEEIGSGRTQPRGDGATPAGRGAVAEDHQAAPAGDEPVAAGDLLVAADPEAVAADDQAVAAGDLQVAADPEAGAADDQAASAGDEPAAVDDQAVAAANLPVAADHQAGAADDQPVPADDLVVIVTEDDQHPPDDQDVAAAADDEGDTPAGTSKPDLAAFVPAGAAPTGGPPSAFAGSHTDDPPAGGAGIVGTPAPDANQPLADEATPAITPGFGPDPGPAQGTGSVSAAGRWPEIQALFVDDPRASVELAADLVDDSLEAFIASVRKLQNSLRSTWGTNDADTEQLRKALQRYRACWRHLHGISIEP